jgi:hypothetical protein
MHIADVQTAWRGAARAFCFARVVLPAVHARRPGKFEGNGHATDDSVGELGSRPEQLLGLARAPRGRLLWIHLRPIYDVAGVMLAWDGWLF